MRWAEGGTCRHDAILRYFGDEAESLDGCGRCDICTSLSKPDERPPEEVTLLVRKALSGVARIHHQFGLNAAIQLLRGKSDERLIRAGLDQISTFGILKELPEEWLLRLLRRFVTAGWVSFVGGDRPLAVLTEAGIAVMKGERPVRLLLPPKQRRLSGKSRGGSSARTVEMPQDSFSAEVQQLFEDLREFRLNRARSEGVPPYVVASDRTLRDLAMLRPRNIEELHLAHGIGPGKAEKYGAGLLRVISQAS